MSGGDTEFLHESPSATPNAYTLKIPSRAWAKVTQIYFKGLEHIFQMKLNAGPDTQNRRGPEPWF